MLKPNSHAPDGQPWHITTLRNRNGMVATFMDWGATWLSARVPMGDGHVREALLGCATRQIICSNPPIWELQSAAMPTALPVHA